MIATIRLSRKASDAEGYAPVSYGRGQSDPAEGVGEVLARCSR